MSLAESLQQIRNFNLDAGPLLEACDKSRDLILQGSQSGIPEDARKCLAQMVAQIDKERAEYVRLFTSGMAELKTDLGRSCDTIAAQMVTRENQLLEIKKLQKQIEAIPIPLDDPEHNPFHPANLVASVPSMPTLPVAEPLPLHPGLDLVAKLMAIRLPEHGGPQPVVKEASFPKVSGNIWENWDDYRR